jgi:hypothetical protein
MLCLRCTVSMQSLQIVDKFTPCKLVQIAPEEASVALPETHRDIGTDCNLSNHDHSYRLLSQSVSLTATLQLVLYAQCHVICSIGMTEVQYRVATVQTDCSHVQHPAVSPHEASPRNNSH